MVAETHFRFGMVVVLSDSSVASTQEVVTPLIANFGKINDLRLHAFETVILGKKNANGILSSDSSLVFGELDNNDSDDIIVINV